MGRRERLESVDSANSSHEFNFVSPFTTWFSLVQRKQQMYVLPIYHIHTWIMLELCKKLVHRAPNGTKVRDSHLLTRAL